MTPRHGGCRGKGVATMRDVAGVMQPVGIDVNAAKRLASGNPPSAPPGFSIDFPALPNFSSKTACHRGHSQRHIVHHYEDPHCIAHPRHAGDHRREAAFHRQGSQWMGVEAAYDAMTHAVGRKTQPFLTICRVIERESARCVSFRAAEVMNGLAPPASSFRKRSRGRGGGCLGW